MAFVAAEAFLVPHCTLSELLLSSKHGTTATRASLTFWGFNCCCTIDDEWTVRVDIVFAVILIVLLDSAFWSKTFKELPLAVSLQETGTTCKSISMGSPFLAITSSTVNILIRTIASDDWVKGLVAVFALEAFLVPFASLGQHHFSSKDRTPTTWATLTRRGFDRGSISNSCLWCMGFTTKRISGERFKGKYGRFKMF